MKKTLGIFLAGIMALSFTFVKAEDAGMNMTLYPGWNVVSTPQILSSISFSNQGNDLSFSELVNGKWVSVSATAANIKPLHGYMVYNSNSSNVTLSLTYKTNVSPTEAVLQKNLNYGWDLLGIATTNSPFNNIGSAAAMSVDFTNNGTTNLKNKVNTKYNWNSTSSSVNNPELGEAYGIFINQQNAVYGGLNNGGTSQGGETVGGNGKYTVKRLDFDGLTLETDTDVQEGTMPEFNGVIPTVFIGKNNFSYIFSGWTPSLVPVVSDATYKAQLTERLLKDSKDRLNVLLIGYGGAGREGRYLVTDSVTVASWDLNTNEVILVSLPNVKVQALTASELVASTKSIVSNLLGLNIEHYATMDFTAFTKAIDAIGGIDIYVDETINDTNYPYDITEPRSNGSYTTFNLNKGNQHLNGTAALKYVRSVHSTSESNRAYRQQKVLQAVKDKITSEGFSITNISTIYNLYSLYTQDIMTDITNKDAIWIVTHLNKIQKISSLKHLGNTNSNLINLKGTFDTVENDISLTSFSIGGNSPYGTDFDGTDISDSIEFKLTIGNKYYEGTLSCQNDNNSIIQCSSENLNLSDFIVPAGETINILLTLDYLPLINFDVDEEYQYYIRLNGESEDKISRTYRIPLSFESYEGNNPDITDLYCSITEELKSAYSWAHENGLTTKSNINDAHVCNYITRVELAEFMAIFAIDLMGKIPDESQVCSFSDTGLIHGNQATAIIKVCQLGLMGNGISAFRPYDTISRAEVGTMLSRLLWGTKYEGGSPYYAKHLDALKSAGIMTQLNKAESIKATISDVLLYLQRASGLENTEEECDAMTKLICNVDPENALCPEACRPEVEPEDENNEEETSTKSGDLKITATANSISNRKVIIGGTSNMDTIKFNPSEEITLSSITLERYGYSNRDQIDSIRLEDENGNMITDVKELNTKDKVSLNFKNNRKNIDDDFSAVIVVSTNDLGSNNGSTISFKVVDVDSTAENLDMTSYTSYIYDLVSYQGSTITISSNTDSLKEYNFVAGDYYEIAKFKVKTSQSNIIIRGFGLSRPNTVNIDITDVIDNLKVSIDDEDVKANFNVNKSGEIVISFDDVEIAAKDTAIVVVTASFDEEFEDYEDNFNQEFYFELKSENFSAVDKKTAARLSFSENSYILPSYVFNKDKIKLTNTKLGNVDAAEGSIDVVIAEGTISLPEPIKGTFSITASNKGIDKLVMSVVGEEYEGSMQEDEKTFVFDKVEFNESGTIKFKADIKEGVAPGTTFDFLPFSLSNATSLIYVGSKEDAKEDTVGSIAFSRITIFSAKAALENNLTQDAKFPLNEISTKTVFEGTYTAKKGDIILNNFKLEGANPGTNSVSFSLVIDDDEVATEELSGDEPYCALGSFSDIRVLAGETVSIKVDAEIDASSAGSLGEYELSLGGEDDDGNSIGPSTANTVSIEILSD